MSAELAGVAAESGDVAAWLRELSTAEPVTILSRSRTTDTSIITLPSLERVVRKRWRWPGIAERLKGLGRTTALASTPAEREFTALARTYGADALAFHPQPLGFLVMRSRGLASEAMLILAEVPGSVDLAHFLRGETDMDSRRRALADLARRTAAMHGDGVTDGDFHPRNVLVDTQSWRTWKVDCGRQRVRRRPADRRRVEYDLACLDVGLARFASRSERIRAIDAYLIALDELPDRRSWIARVAALSAQIEPKESSRLPPARNE